MYFSLESWDLLPQGRLCGRGLAVGSLDSNFPTTTMNLLLVPHTWSLRPLIHVCPLPVYWHWCHTHQLPSEPKTCPFPAPFPYDCWVCACTCAERTCIHTSLPRPAEPAEFGGMGQVPAECWPSLLEAARNCIWCSWLEQLLCLPNVKWPWPSVAIHWALSLCLEPRSVMFCFLCDLLSAPCSPALGTALSPWHHLAEPAPCYHSLAVTTGEAWASLSVPTASFPDFIG